MDRKVNVSFDKFSKIARHKVGEGRDAVVYNAGKGLLYKVYKAESNLGDLNSPVRVYDRETVIRKSVPERNCYVDSEGIKIFYKDAIKRIVKRQESIKESSLPVSALYVNKKFSGCVVKKVNGIQLHYIFPFLSRKRKIKVLKTIISKIKELTDNYIYPCDVANSPIVGNHSNILVDFRLRPQIIDLDGHSTLYRESYDEKGYNLTLSSLNLLIIELLHGAELDEDLLDEDVKYLMENFIEDGVSEEMAYKLSRYQADYDELDKLVMHYSKLK